ncbi:MAG: YHS domain-containing protein [Pyrinomonadaceae bacterium]
MSSEQAIVPVCGTTVNKQTAAGSLTHEGTTYFFCSAHCVEAFRKDPGRFLMSFSSVSVIANALRLRRVNP